MTAHGAKCKGWLRAGAIAVRWALVLICMPAVGQPIVWRAGVVTQAPYAATAADGTRVAVKAIKAGLHANREDLARFRRITNAGLRESHVHDVTITRESPNYPTRS